MPETRRFNRIRYQKPFRNGPDHVITSLRLGSMEIILRRLCHLMMGWLPRSESIDVKFLFGIHLHEDAQFITRIRSRLRELEGEAWVPLNPGAELREVIEYIANIDTWQDFVSAVYSVLKPGLVDISEKHFTTTDQMLDEPTTRLMSEMMRVTSQHIGGGMSLVETLFQDSEDSRKHIHESAGKMREIWQRFAAAIDDPTFVESPMRPPHLLPPIKRLARDSFIRIADDGSGAGSDESDKAKIHAAMNSDLERGEIIAECSHSNPQLPWEFHEDAARLTWDQMRHAMVLEKILEMMDGEWGDLPVVMTASDKLLEQPVAERLRKISYRASHCSREGRLCQFGDMKGTDEFYPFLVCGYFRSDDRYFSQRCLYWSEMIVLKGLTTTTGLGGRRASDR